jgi:hypothetical protein
MRNNMQLLNHRELEEHATRAVVRWLTQHAPSTGKDILDLHGDRPGALEDLVYERLMKDSGLALHAAEEAYFTLLDLKADGKAFWMTDWDRVLRELRRSFER